MVKSEKGGQDKVVKNEKSALKRAEKKQGIETRSLIVQLIKGNPRITRRELENQLKISSSAIQKHINFLKEQGTLVREGDAKRGSWKIVE